MPQPPGEQDGIIDRSREKDRGNPIERVNLRMKGWRLGMIESANVETGGKSESEKLSYQK